MASTSDELSCMVIIVLHAVTYKGPRNILSANESQSDVSVGESLSTVMLPVILTVTLLVSVLVAVITCVIWHLHVQVRYEI